MQFQRHRAVQASLAAVVLFALPAEQPPAPAPPIVEKAPPVASESACLASTLCSVKKRVRPGSGTAPWTPEFCQRVADAVVASAKKYDLSPALVAAVMLNESDLDEKAVRLSTSRGKPARDSGLMGIRCVLDGRGRCTNAFVRGMTWRQVMVPETNVELGARYLAHYRTEGGREEITLRDVDEDGLPKTRSVRCKHRNHAYWAHYNHGTRYIGRGDARHYPGRVAAIYRTLAETLSMDGEDLLAKGAAQPDPGIGERPKKICALIRTAGVSCPAAVVSSHGAAPRQSTVAQSTPRDS